TARSMPSTAARSPKRLLRPSVSMARASLGGPSAVGDCRFQGRRLHQPDHQAAVVEEDGVDELGLQQHAVADSRRRLQEILGQMLTRRGKPLAASTAMATWSIVESAECGTRTSSYTGWSATYAGVVTETAVDGVMLSSRRLASSSGVGVGSAFVARSASASG